MFTAPFVIMFTVFLARWHERHLSGIKTSINLESYHVLQTECNTTFKVSATISFNLNATEASVRVRATPCCI